MGSPTCTKGCKVICPAATPPKGMKISYDRGRVWGSKAKYICTGSGKPARKGSAVSARYIDTGQGEGALWGGQHTCRAD